MIESYGTLYAGHVDFEEVGFDAPALNDRWLTEDKLNSVYNLSLIHISEPTRPY